MTFKKTHILFYIGVWLIRGFPDGSDGKESAYNAGNCGLIPGSGRSPGEGDGNPLQHSCLDNSMDRGAWQASPWGHEESDMTEHLIYTHTHTRLINNFVIVSGGQQRDSAMHIKSDFWICK